MEETKLNEEDTVENNFETDLELEKSLRHMKFASKAIAILIVVMLFVAGVDAYQRRGDINITNRKLQNIVDAIQEYKGGDSGGKYVK